MPTGVVWIQFLSGPVVIVAYLVSAVVRGWLVDRRVDGTTALVAEAAAPTAAALATWVVIESQAPARSNFQNASAIGFLSSQVLTVWSSLALWAGLAALVGQMAPASKRFRRGTSGVPGAFVLLVTFFPATAVAAIGSWVTSLAMTRDPRPALALTYGAVVAVEWIFSVVNPSGPWGLVHGPESTLFTAVLAGALLFRWAGGDVGTPAPTTDDRSQLDDP